MRKRLILLLAFGLALALSVSACGAVDDEEAPDEEATALGAAELRADLAARFQEQPYLIGIAVKSVLDSDGDLEALAAQAAIETLDGSSQALADAIGSVYGDDPGEELLSDWSEHADLFIQYAVGRATGDDVGVERAEQGLEDFATTFGQFMAEESPELDAETVAEALDPHVEATRQAIDELVEDDAAAFATLHRAAGQMPDLAAVLASTIAEQFPDQFPGDPDSPASELRTDLTAGLQENEYLTGIAVLVLVDSGGAIQAEDFQAASGALDESSIALADTIGSAYDDEETRQRFLETWRDHSTLFVDYALARITGDDAGAERAEEGLDRSRRTFGQLVADASPSLTAEEAGDALEPHLDTTTTAIDSIAAGDDEAIAQLRTAAAEMPALASTLADAIAAASPERFGAA